MEEKFAYCPAETLLPIMADRPGNSDNDRGESEINTNNDIYHDSTENLEPVEVFNNSQTETHAEGNPSLTNHSNSSSHCSGGGSGASSKHKESNPYSFKHFLTGGKQNVGTCQPHHTSSLSSNKSEENNAMNPSNVSSCSRTNRNLILNNPDLASGLPDFVQDHLIMEQCFLEPNSNIASNSSFNLENSHIYHLENAILNSSTSEESPNAIRSANANNIPFDLTSTMPSENQEGESTSNTRQGRPRDPPLDLPSSSVGGLGSVNSSEVGASKSLPDFLSDGPLHQRRTDDSTESDRSTLPYSPHELSPVEIQSLQTENLQLRREVEWLSSALKESNDRLERRERRHRATANNLEKELDSTRENLRRTMERAIAAEATVCQLQQEFKSFKVHNSQQSEESISNCNNSGDGDRTVRTVLQDTRQRLGNEIQNIASSTETSLRQMLNNMEALKLIASSLEKTSGESSHQGNTEESKDD